MNNARFLCLGICCSAIFLLIAIYGNISDGALYDIGSEDPLEELTGEMVQKLTKQGSQFSGFLPPVNSNGSSMFSIGEVIPVKFQLRDINWDFVKNARIIFTAEKVNGSLSDSKLGSYPPSTFQYHNLTEVYSYDWPTVGLQDGTWAIRAYLYFGDERQSVLQGPPPIPSGMSGMLTLRS